MPIIKVDADGVPFWEQPVATKWDYTVDWRARLNATGDQVVSAAFSALTSGLGVTSVSFTASGLHTAWVSPSAGNATNNYYFASKVFTTFGRIERARIKVSVEELW